MIAISEAKPKLSALATAHTPTILSKNGKALSVIVPFEMYKEMYNLWKEAQYQKAKTLAGDYENLEYVSEEELDRILEDSIS
ncbi:hypothetical protein WDW89_18575 [Deltaproteobacteria bacterium TL4]